MNDEKKEVLPKTVKLRCGIFPHCYGYGVVFCLCNTQICSYHPAWNWADRGGNLYYYKKIRRGEKI